MWTIHLCGEQPEHPLFVMGNSSGKSRVSDHVAFETSPTPPIPNIVIHAATPLNSPAGAMSEQSFPRSDSPDSRPEDPLPPPLPRTPPPPLPSTVRNSGRGRSPSMASLGIAAAKVIKQRKDSEKRERERQQLYQYNEQQQHSLGHRRPSQPRLFNAPPIGSIDPYE